MIKSRIGELNTVIKCGCTPVLFVLAKKASKNESYRSFLARFRIRFSRSSKDFELVPERTLAKSI